jgi:hypothetical protein
LHILDSDEAQDLMRIRLHEPVSELFATARRMLRSYRMKRTGTTPEAGSLEREVRPAEKENLYG